MNKTVIIEPKNGRATGSLIFLHGTGDSGRGLREGVQSLLGREVQLPHIRILFPTAPLIPFNAYGGMRVNTWYDISDFSDDAIENVEHIEQSAQLISGIIKSEVSQGIPTKRIAIAGFSRGGAMSYYIGYSYFKDLACVGVMSSWLPKTSKLYEMFKQSKNLDSLPPLFQTHGGSDFVIDKHLGQNTVELLKSSGIKTEFKVYPSTGHELSPSSLKDLYSFILNIIPDT